jgi:hypothetical protein
MPSLVSRRLSLANPRQSTTYRRRQHSQLAITTCFFVVENLHFAQVFSTTWMVAGNPMSEGKTLLLRPYDIRHYSPFTIKMMLQVLCAFAQVFSTTWMVAGNPMSEGKTLLMRPYDIRHYSPFTIKMMLQVLCATLVATSSSWLSSFNEGKIPYCSAKTRSLPFRHPSLSQTSSILIALRHTISS